MELFAKEKMYRRAHRVIETANSKAEDNLQALWHQDSSADDTRRRMKRSATPNPFRNHSHVRVRGTLAVTALGCVSLCVLVPCLTGFISSMRPADFRGYSGLPIRPRTFTLDQTNNVERAVPQVPPEKRPLALARMETEGRIRKQAFLNIPSRRAITQRIAPIRDSPPALGPIGIDERDHFAEYNDDGDAFRGWYEKEEVDESECGIPAFWTEEHRMACSSMHEINVMPSSDSFAEIGCGGDRCAFLITDADNNKVVLKLQHYERPYDKAKIDSYRMDATVMAMLSGSPYFVDIYGHCGSSQIVEYCSNGNIHDIVNYARVTEEEKLAPIDKLRIAIQVTTAVSDLHEIDVVHQDICCHQFNFVDGVYKLSDFNIGALIFRDKQTKELCPAPRASMSDAVLKLRAPEELVDDVDELLDLKKVDVYMMGNILYYLLTNHWLFEGYNRDEAMDATFNGHRSEISSELLESPDPAISALVDALDECWYQEPEDRPSARKISDFLKAELGRLEQIDDLGVVRVQLPPLPAAFLFNDTSSDFEENLVFEHSEG